MYLEKDLPQHIIVIIGGHWSASISDCRTQKIKLFSIQTMLTMPQVCEDYWLKV